MRKQAKGKAIKKHMRNGGMNSFNFHPSPRMVPHVFRPEAQFLELSIEKFVPRGKQVKDCDNPVPVPAYKNKLTDAESDLLAKYFGEICWRPSLIAFPHFQAFPSPVDKVVHSSRTGMLIDTMQGLTFSKDSKVLSAEDKDILNPFFTVEAMEPHDDFVEDSERSSDIGEEKPNKEFESDIEVEEIAKDMHIEDLRKHKPTTHTPLFGSKFVSVDDVGKVAVSLLPQLPLDSMHDSGNQKDMTVQNKENPSSCSTLPKDDLLESSPCNPDREKWKLFSEDEEIVLESPVYSRMSKEMDESYEDDIIVHDMDSELSPRLTNFIESGIVPESPVNSSGTWKNDKNTLEDCNLGKMDVPCPNDDVHDTQTPVRHKNSSSSRACVSPPIPLAEEMQTPLAKVSNTSGSQDWLLDSGVKPETVERQCKLRRLRKLGDLDKKVPSAPKVQTGPKKKIEPSKGTGDRTSTKLVTGKKKRARDVAVFIEEEAEVSSDDIESDNEEDDQIKSSYEDSFIDDGGVNPTSVSTQADVGRTDMMAIYRRSLLSQSPFQRLPTEFSPDSVVQSSSRIDESGSSLLGPKTDQTPQTGLQSTARISQFASSSDSLKRRKLSYYQAQSVPMVNLDKQFSLLSETAAQGKENSSMQQIKQGERIEENNINIFEDDRFFEGIDLDALEEEAAKLFRKKSECSDLKTTSLSEPVRKKFDVMDTPSFDLGI